MYSLQPGRIPAAQVLEMPSLVEDMELVREQSKLNLCDPPVLVHGPRDLQGWMLDWLGNLDDTEMVIGTMTIYQLWLARNDAREEAKMPGPQDIAKRLISALASKPASVMERWLPPGWLT